MVKTCRKELVMCETAKYVYEVSMALGFMLLYGAFFAEV